MSQSERDEKKEQREVFGNLFGFLKGDRVKFWQKYYWGTRGYWVYGYIENVSTNTQHNEPLYVIRIPNTYRRRTHRAKDLVRSRKYERRI